MAEKLYVKAGHPKDAIDMYTKANMYEAAHKVSQVVTTCLIYFIEFILFFIFI